MFNVKTLHHSAMDLLNSTGTIAWDIAMVGEGIKSG
jgi:hypothetical protein